MTVKLTQKEYELIYSALLAGQQNAKCIQENPSNSRGRRKAAAIDRNTTSNAIIAISTKAKEAFDEQYEH